MYILDNNILNTLFYPSPARQNVLRRMGERGRQNVWLSVVTVYEKLFNGVLPALGLNSPREVTGFDSIKNHIEKLNEFQILPFTDEDYGRFKEVYQSVKKAPLDCRLAASALTRGWTVITHDKKDFSRIQTICGVRYEDWSVTPLE